jgi:hypothetical protein
MALTPKTSLDAAHGAVDFPIGRWADRTVITVLLHPEQRVLQRDGASFRLAHSPKLRNRAACPGDDNSFAALYSRNESGELSLRSVDVDGLAAHVTRLAIQGGLESGPWSWKRRCLPRPQPSVRKFGLNNDIRFPDAIIQGKEYPFNRHTAGMLFFNDEGSENGGLIFGGQKTKDGTVSSYGHLSFDRYNQDQELNLEYLQDGSGQSTKLAFLDQPEWPISDLLKQPRSQWGHFAATHPHSTPRLMMQRAGDGSVSLGLKDAQGHTRILIEVAADGTPIIRLLDPSGKIVSQLSPSK